jgi:hypothetical protein
MGDDAQTDSRLWQLAQVRLSRTELQAWHAAAKSIDLRLSQLVRRAVRGYIEQLGAAAADD